MSNMNNPIFRKLYNEILEKKLKAYAANLETELNNLPTTIKGAAIGNTVGSGAADIIPSGGILESVHKGNSLLDKLSRNNIKAVGITAALIGSMVGGLGFGVKVGLPAYKAAESTYSSNMTTLKNLPLVTSTVYGPEAKLGLGVANSKIVVGKEAYNYTSADALGMYSPGKDTVYLPDAGNLSTAVHEISHANQQNWPKAWNTRPGFIGNYGEDSLVGQLEDAYKNSGYRGRIESNIKTMLGNLKSELEVEGKNPEDIKKILDINKYNWNSYWLDTDEMTSRLVERISSSKGLSEPIENFIKDKNTLDMYPTPEEAEKLKPIFKIMTNDSNVIRFSKLYPELDTKLNQTRSSLFFSNVYNILRKNKTIGPTDISSIKTPKPIINHTPNFKNNDILTEVYSATTGQANGGNGVKYKDLQDIDAHIRYLEGK